MLMRATAKGNTMENGVAADDRDQRAGNVREPPGNPPPSDQDADDQQPEEQAAAVRGKQLRGELDQVRPTPRCASSPPVAHVPVATRS